MKVSVQNITIGKNPRRFFDPSEMEDLEQSIRSIGLVQPVVLKENGDGTYLLVAGERRLRAYKAIHGEQAEIPATFPEDTDVDVHVASLVENIQRANMSPTEEASSAYELVLKLNGDMDEACRLLGWKPDLMKRRLALKACHAHVATALDERRILLGHAELLATLSQDRQTKALKSVLAHKISVADLKKQLNGFAQELASAIFDKSDCVDCQYNSDCQSSLFAETVDSGRCTGVSCFSDKTTEELQKRADELRSTGKYPVVKLVSADNEGTYLPVDEETVGAEQFVACQACAHFGAGVSESPAALGDVTGSLCFDLACNNTKTAAFAKQQSMPAKAATAAPASATRPLQTSTAGPANPVGQTTTIPAATANAAPKTEITPSGAMLTYRRNAWNIAAKRFLVESDHTISIGVITATLATRNTSNAKIKEAAEAVFGKQPSIDDAWKLADPAAAGNKKHGQLHQALAYAIVLALDPNGFSSLMAALDVKIANYWKINEEFLALLTKSDLELLVQEINLPATPKMFAGKKAEGISEIMAAEGKGFDFTGVVPKVMKI